MKLNVLLCVLAVSAVCVVSAHEMGYTASRSVSSIPMIMKRPIRPVPMLRTISVRNLTRIFMHALNTRNPFLLMALTDSDTVFAYPSDLPFGGLYKGRRGLLQLGDICHRTLRVTSSKYKIMDVDEDRGTASVLITKTAIARRTNRTVNARMVLSLKFTLNKLICMDVVELDHARVHAALRTRAESLWARLGETWYEHGITNNLMQLLADNITFTFGATSPHNLIKITGKTDVSKHVKHTMEHSHEASDACKLLHCLFNHTEFTKVIHADDSRVVVMNLAGENVLKEMNRFSRHTEGTVIPGVSRIGHFSVYFMLYDFDNSGKLTRVHVHLNRVLTLLDRVYLRNTYGITIHDDSDV